MVSFEFTITDIFFDLSRGLVDKYSSHFNSLFAVSFCWITEGFLKEKKANDTAGNITSEHTKYNTVASVLPCVPLEQSYRNQLADTWFIYGTINTAKLIIAFANSKFKFV